MKRLSVVILVLALVGAFMTGTASADQRVGYTEPDARLVYSSAAYLGQDVDTFISTGISVHHFVLGISGKLKNPTAGCNQNLSVGFKTDNGPYRINATKADPKALAAVGKYYCLSENQVAHSSATLLVFLTGIDANNKGTTRPNITPPAPTPPTGPAVAAVDIPNGASVLPPGTYRATADQNCNVARLGAADAIVAANYFLAGEQIVVTIDPSDTKLFVTVTGGARCADDWQRIDLDRKSEITPLQPGKVPTGFAIVGVDLQPGLYRTVSTSDNCNVFRTGNFGLDLNVGTIVHPTTFTVNHQIVIEVQESDVNFVYGPECGEFKLITVPGAAALRPGTTMPPGVLIRGVDVAPGTYTATTTGVCLARRLQNFRLDAGSFTGTVVFVAANTPITVNVGTGDAGFITQGACGTFTKTA